MKGADEKVAARIGERLNRENAGELFVVIASPDAGEDAPLNTDPALGVAMSLLGPRCLRLVDEGEGVVAIYAYATEPR